MVDFHVGPDCGTGADRCAIAACQLRRLVGGRAAVRWRVFAGSMALAQAAGSALVVLSEHHDPGGSGLLLVHLRQYRWHVVDGGGQPVAVGGATAHWNQLDDRTKCAGGTGGAELTRVNSELRATQSLLAENTRIAERVRIARELHDLVGHHLTALTLNLEVSTHLIEGKALEHVEQARSIARLLLTDVREVVSEMRSNDGVNLADAVRMLTDGVPRPRIHLDIPDNFKVTDPQRAQVLLRCAQEAITNAVRHSGASILWLSLHSENQELELQVRDDGSGASAEDLGNGLRGMRERLRQLGGELVLTSALGQGFNLHVHLPMEHSV
jgi:signal transduction histidine kinase